MVDITFEIIVIFRFLQDNKFTQIPIGSFTNMPSLKHLRLDSNKINCDCSIEWFVTAIKIRKNLVTSMMCAQPVKMAGKSITSLKENDFDCCKYFRYRCVV